MKKIFMLTILAIAGINASAQDIITKKNADELEVKVVKVGVDEIEYKEWDNLDGPIYTIQCSDVFTIKYQNGKRDVISLLDRYKKPYAGGRYPKYQGEIAFAYVLGFSSLDRLSFETVHGVRIMPYLFTGLGVACNYFYDYNSYVGSYGKAIALPVFVNFKGYYPFSQKTSIYCSFDIGAAVGVSALFGSSFYTSVGPGFTFGHGDFSIRYQYMDTFLGFGSSAMQFRLGLRF